MEAFLFLFLKTQLFAFNPRGRGFSNSALRLGTRLFGFGHEFRGRFLRFSGHVPGGLFEGSVSGGWGSSHQCSLHPACGIVTCAAKSVIRDP